MIIKEGTGSTKSQIVPPLSRKYVGISENCETCVLSLRFLPTLVKKNLGKFIQGHGRNQGIYKVKISCGKVAVVTYFCKYDQHLKNKSDTKNSKKFFSRRSNVTFAFTKLKWVSAAETKQLQYTKPRKTAIFNQSN